MSLNVRKKWPEMTVVAFTYVPILIFLWGFTKWYIALLTSGFLLWGLYHFVSDILKMKTAEAEESPVGISILMLVFAAVVITVLCVVLGVGGFFPQAGDWYKHNAVLNDLIALEWPVYYDAFDDRCMLTYYLGQYLVPAVAGKLFGGFMTGSMTMFITCLAGLIVIYILLVRVTKADTVLKQTVLLFVMLFFCGALNLTQAILQQICGEKFYSYGSYHWVIMNNIYLQYRSNTVMIRWILPQIIVPWMTVLMLLLYRKKTEYYVLIILPSLLFGSFSFAALALMAVCEAVYLVYRGKSSVSKVFSFTNILPAISLGPVLYFYFLGNIQVAKPISSSFRFQFYNAQELPVYIVFCLFMFGTYFACTYRRFKNDSFWYINLVILLILPWLRMGLCNDVVMSGSIPSLFVLMIMVCCMLFENGESTALGICKGITIVFLLIGCIYPVKEISDNITLNEPGMELTDKAPTMKWFTNRHDPDISEDLVYNYYTYDPEGKIFYEYMARRK